MSDAALAEDVFPNITSKAVLAAEVFVNISPTFREDKDFPPAAANATPAADSMYSVTSVGKRLL